MGKVYRITTFFKKRADITDQQFYDHWGNVHGPLVIPWAMKYGFLEYTQYQTPAELREIFASHMDPAFSAPIPFNAAADFYIDSYERFLAAFSDPYYIAVIEPDERNFVDKGQLDKDQSDHGGEGLAGKRTVVRAMSTLGHCRSMIRDGKAAVEVEDRIWDRFTQYQQHQIEGPQKQN